MRRLFALIITTFLAVVLAIGTTAVPAAAAAPRFSRIRLTISVTGHTVHVSTKVKARSTTTVDRYGVCVRDARDTILDFSPKARHKKISKGGTTYTATRTLPNGRFTVWTCLRHRDHWIRVGSVRHITIALDPSAPAPSPTPDPTPAPGPTAGSTVPADSDLLFSDDFDGSAGSAYDHGKWGEWSGCTYNSSAFYGKIACGDRSVLDGQGHLSIPATPNAGTSISTKDTFGFVYGEVSAWLKNPDQAGFWPAFWTLNNNADGHDTLPLGEADVMEAYTTWPTIYHRGTHTWNNEKTWGSPDDPYCGGVDLSAAFHKYTARVEPGQMTFLFDDHVCGRVELRQDGNGKPYGFGPDVIRPNWLILTLAVGGAGGQQKLATQNAALLVDRVEVRAVPRS